MKKPDSAVAEPKQPSTRGASKTSSNERERTRYAPKRNERHVACFIRFCFLVFLALPPRSQRTKGWQHTRREKGARWLARWVLDLLLRPSDPFVSSLLAFSHLCSLVSFGNPNAPRYAIYQTLPIWGLLQVAAVVGRNRTQRPRRASEGLLKLRGSS